MTRVYLYDTTLRDGAQTYGVDFTLADKRAIALALDDLGIDMIEAGWPGANPTDTALFDDLPSLRHARFSAFGMTRRSGRSASNDPGLNKVLQAGVSAVCLVGKTWDFHVTRALEISLEENVAIISDSIAHARSMVTEVLFDAEHFFDGFKHNPGFALDCVKAAADAGARWIVVCDTNGGTPPDEVERIVAAVAEVIPGDRLGIHCHDDTGNAVANSLAAVRAGARQIQGTLNGLGERCGNANLITLIPTLMLKMGYELGVTEAALSRLTRTSRLLDERLGRPANARAPYVGDSAFAHKGGLHVSAVAKDSRSYEHIDPAAVGNVRHIVVSDQAGRANILARLVELGMVVDHKDPRIGDLGDLVKARESAGYAYEGAGASFELLARRLLNIGAPPPFFRLVSYKVVDERHERIDGDIETLAEATIEIEVDGAPLMVVAQGNGPVDALDAALRQALEPVYPLLQGVQLSDYKVRILTPEDGTKALTRVLIESKDTEGLRWSTVGVAPNVIDASYLALQDSLVYRLMRG